MNDHLDSIICLRPFYSLELHIKGDVSVCCPAWSKGMVGNLHKKSLLEIWNDAPLQKMRRMMLEGKWEKVCRPTCPVIMNYRATGERTRLAGEHQYVITEEILSAVRSRQTVLTTGPTWINLANSTICNLNCIMCGREYYKESARLSQKTITEVKALLPGLREIFLAGNGDPFARPDTRELMLSLDSSLCPDLRFDLLTNGLLLPRYWDRIRHLNLGGLNISVDAATPQTYEIVRRGGRWRDLVCAFELVRDNRDRFSQIIINMTVMRENYREIPAFVELAARYGFAAGISKIRGKWANQNIFTSGEPGISHELRDTIMRARQRAGELGVPFYYAEFNDILAGETVTFARRNKQRIIDTLVQVYHTLKP